ncbi:MAG: ECF transporter S component [Lachnospiraceae bacterium]
MKEKLRMFSVFDLIVIALMSGLGLAMKPIIVPLIHIITGPLFIPGGAVAGGFYMLWIMLAMGIVKKKGTCALVGIVQGIMVITMGSIGSHGIASLLTYALPGVFAEIPFLFSKDKKFNMLHFLFAGVFANLAGTYGSNLVFFNLPLIPLFVSLSAASVSGALGGMISFNISNKLQKFL